MHTLHKIKKTITIVTLLLIVLVSLSPLTSAEVIINADDGIWTEDFLYESLDDAKENLLIENGKIDFENGIVSLQPSTHSRTYNFLKYNDKDFSHKAGSYFTNFFSKGALRSQLNMPDTYNNRYIFEEPDYKNIVKENNDYATRELTGLISILNRQIIQEFQFKLDVGPEIVGDIDIYWKGKAENVNNVAIYYWGYQDLEILPQWIELETSDEEDIIFNETINKTAASLALMENNYLFISIVANKKPGSFFKPYSLGVDYIEVISASEKTFDTGPAYITIRNPIKPEEKDFYWESLNWIDHQSDKTEIKYQVLFDPIGKGNLSDLKLVPDKYFSESNEEGFTESPIYLNQIPTSGINAIKNIYIRANLTSQHLPQTPKLYNVAVTWQTNPKEWKDSFNSSYRIESKTLINVADGSVNLSSLQGEWPMYGYSSEGTRATDGKGPQMKNPTFTWYTAEEQFVGGGFRNPVIGDGYLYIFGKLDKNSNNDFLLKYDIQQSRLENYYNLGIREFKNSPAITDDYIIIASGKSQTGGNTNNRILGISKDFKSSWQFNYGQETPISYLSSPVVYDNKLYITSWSGDTSFKILSEHETNKVIAIDLDKVTSDVDTDHPAFLWEYDLPAASYTTPAVYDDMVIVGCISSIGKHDTIFALDAVGNGDKKTTNLLWSVNVGSIGRSSPIIYDNTVFITSKKAAGLVVSAIDINPESSSRILWQKTMRLDIPLIENVDLTPAVYDGVLYVSSPRGSIYALDTKNGEILWENEDVYSTLRKNLLTSSPAYADGFLYLGTPEGRIIALDTQNKGSIHWTNRYTYNIPNSFIKSPIYSSPIISNGMLFISDEHGRLYAIGQYEEVNKEVQGSLISIPINLPTGTWWGRFYANYTKPAGSTMKFSILDNNKEHLGNISSGDFLNLGEFPSLRTIYLSAELFANNLSVNPSLNCWKITFVVDNQKPEFVEHSFKPNPKGWLNTTTPHFSIEVWDNQTGLLLDTTQYTLKYIAKGNNDTLQHKATPEYTGQNGVNHSVLSVDVSTVPFAENISRLVSIQFNINDIANNENSIIFNLKQDTTKPISQISDETNGSRFNTEFVIINATAHDPGNATSASGVKRVKLYYRHSLTSTFSGNWIYYDDSNKTKPSWEFTNKKGGGYYQLCTIAIDEVGNVEDFPETADTTFIMDNTAPKKPVYSGEHWFNSRPNIQLEFSDDFLLDTIKYKPNFDTTEWITIASNISKKTYTEAWDLKEEFWDMMDNEKQYVLMFWINDTLGNERIITEDEGYKIFKDKNKPIVDVTIPSIRTTWTMDDTLLISAFAHDGQGSGIESVELFYRYSENGTFAGEWLSYGVVTTEPFEWEFKADEGDGYYEFKIVAEDAAGNVAESNIVSTGITQFPTALVAAMIGLISVLLIVGVVVIIKWRKK